MPEAKVEVRKTGGITAPVLPEKPRAIKASEVEQAEKRKAAAIMTKSESPFWVPRVVKELSGTRVRARLVSRAPTTRYFPTSKNSSPACKKSARHFEAAVAACS